MWQRVMAVAGCGCVGGFVTSALGHHVGAFAGMDMVGAAAFAGIAAWVELV